MNENELKSLEVYNAKFKEDPTSFNDFQANDYIKLLKKSDNKKMKHFSLVSLMISWLSVNKKDTRQWNHL